MTDIPPTMRALVAPAKVKPDKFEIRDMPTPSITEPDDMLIRVHATGIQTGETQMAAGQLAVFNTPKYPYILGMEGSGVVVDVGSNVKLFKPGDEVYGIDIVKPMFVGRPSAMGAQYATVRAHTFLPKPKNLSFEEAASFTGHVVTAYQVIRRGLQKRGEESLEGKTVYIPAALSATGSVIIQVAKNVFGASKIISTVSTAKMPLVEEYLPGMVDQVIDYTKQKPVDVVPRGSVDFMVNTQWGSMNDGIPLLNPKTGTLMSITSLPSRATVQEMIPHRFTWWLGLILDLGQYYYKWLLRGTNLEHEMISGSPHIREDLEKGGEIIARGQVKPVIRVIDLEDVSAIREGLMQVFTGKGGVGKMVVRMP